MLCAVQNDREVICVIMLACWLLTMPLYYCCVLIRLTSVLIFFCCWWYYCPFAPYIQAFRRYLCDHCPIVFTFIPIYMYWHDLYHLFNGINIIFITFLLYPLVLWQYWQCDMMTCDMCIWHCGMCGIAFIHCVLALLYILLPVWPWHDLPIQWYWPMILWYSLTTWPYW